MANYDETAVPQLQARWARKPRGVYQEDICSLIVEKTALLLMIEILHYLQDP